MDRDLISTALAFSPLVLPGNRKKKTPAKATTKLSLRRRATPKQQPPLPPPLREYNTPLRQIRHECSDDRHQTISCPGKENHSCCCSQLVTSDSEAGGIENFWQTPVSKVIGDDCEAQTTITAKSHSTYLTCFSQPGSRVSRLQNKVTINSSHDECEDELQSSFCTLAIETPKKTEEIIEDVASSCEKVQQWLSRMSLSSGDETRKDHKFTNKTILETSSSDEEEYAENSKDSSCAYPNTAASTTSPTWTNESYNGTSQQSNPGESERLSLESLNDISEHKHANVSAKSDYSNFKRGSLTSEKSKSFPNAFQKHITSNCQSLKKSFTKTKRYTQQDLFDSEESDDMLCSSSVTRTKSLTTIPVPELDEKSPRCDEASSSSISLRLFLSDTDEVYQRRSLSPMQHQDKAGSNRPSPRPALKIKDGLVSSTTNYSQPSALLNCFQPKTPSSASFESSFFSLHISADILKESSSQISFKNTSGSNIMKKSFENPSLPDTVPYQSSCDSAPLVLPSTTSSEIIYNSFDESFPSIPSPLNLSGANLPKKCISESDSISGDSDSAASLRSTSLQQEVEVKSTEMTVRRNISCIEISSSPDTPPVQHPESSDTEEESPYRFVRKRADRASYLEIVISDTESDSEDERPRTSFKNFRESRKKPKKSALVRSPDVTTLLSSSDSDDESNDSVKHVKKGSCKQRSNSLSDLQEESDSPASKKCDSPILQPKVAAPGEDSEETHFSEVSGSNRSNPDLSPPRRSCSPLSSGKRAETQDKVARKISFTQDTSSSENEEEEEDKCEDPTSRKQTIPKKIASTPPRRNTQYLDTSSDDDERLEQFFRKRREQAKHRPVSSEDDSPNFIVPDEEEVSEEEEVSKDKKEFAVSSPSFYLRMLNNERRQELFPSEMKLTKPRIPPSFSTPTPKRGKQYPKTAGRPDKARFVNGPTFSPVLSFLASLSGSVGSRMHPEAVPYTKNFRAKKEELSYRLFSMFNRSVFMGKLPEDLKITWNNRLRTTAGFCYNQRKVSRNGDYHRICRIELSTKILNESSRLRDTLIHELCHAATWVISGQLGGHGPIWKQWAMKAMARHPELPEIKRCHSYQIQTKYTFRCTQCGYSFGRHSKSLDLTKKLCGLCHGKFELLVNNVRTQKPATPRTPNVFAVFVQQNYRLVKNDRKSLKHADVMKMLSHKFAQQKLAAQ